MNARAKNFLVANEVSPVVYGSVNDGCVTYRLADGKMFHLNLEEARQAPNPRWAFLEREANAKAKKLHRAEERALLARVTAEALSSGPERGE